MSRFSRRSASRLATCDARLIRLFEFVVVEFDCTILGGHRGRKLQDRLFDAGKSKVRFPNSRHNSTPSLAVDAAPYPVDWEDRERFVYFGGFVKGMATALEIPIRWGGDWDRDTRVKDNDFDDLVHFELIGDQP